MFLDAPGGTSKTLPMNLILSVISFSGKIILSKASSGIMATLITVGHMTHTMLIIPLDTYCQEQPMYDIKKGTTLAEVIQDASAIIVDEAPMTHKTVCDAMN